MVKHQIKYTTIDRITHSIAVFEKNNSIDLTFLGEITQLRLPNSILKSKEKIKISVYFNIFFHHTKDYFNFFSNNATLPNSFLTFNNNYKLDNFSDCIIKNENSIFFSPEKNCDNEILNNKKFGDIKEYKYDFNKHCAFVEFYTSKQIMNTHLYFNNQYHLVERLSKAIRKNKLNYLKTFYTFLENKNLKNKDNNSLAFVAAWNGNLNALKFLYENGSEIDGYVSIAAARHLHILKYLDNNGLLKVSFRDENGFNPFQQACNIGNTFYSEISHTKIQERLLCIDFLLSKNANINFKNNFGRTALMTAANCNSSILVNHLLQHNADVDIVCNDGKRAIDYSNCISIDFNISLEHLNYKKLMNLRLYIKNIPNKKTLKFSTKNKLDNLLDNLSLILDVENYRNISIPIEEDTFKTEFAIFKCLHNHISNEFINEIEFIINYFKTNHNLDNYDFKNYNYFINEFNKILDKKTNKKKLIPLNNLILIK